MTNKEFFIAHIQKEMKRTLKALEGLNDDMQLLQFKPDAKSRSALQIISHILPHNEAMCLAIDSKDIFEEDKTFGSMKEAQIYLEQTTKAFIEKMQTVSDDTWDNEIISLSIPSQKNLYRAVMRELFWVLVFDTIHHRGQLSTYYRQMGLRNPSIYGPTAEDAEELAQKN